MRAGDGKPTHGRGWASRRSPVRIAFMLILGFGLVAGVRAADDAPTPDEQKTIDAITKLGGKATIDPKLHTEARVAVKVMAPTDRVLTELKKHPQVGALDLADT